MDKNPTTPENKLINIWEKATSITSFLSNLNKLEIPTPYLLSSFVFFSPNKSILTHNYRLPSSFEIKAIKEKNNSVLYYLNTYYGKRKGNKIEGNIILFQESSDISFLFTVSKREFIQKCLLRFISYSYPNIIQPVLTQKNLKEILSKTEEKFLPSTIQIVKSTAKRWIISRKTSSQSRQIGSRIDWEKMSIEEVFNEAAEEGKWFTKLIFNVNIRNTSYKGIISRKELFSTNKWFDQYSIIIDHFSEITKEKLKLYQNRSRSADPHYKIHPLIIKFDDNVFEDRENNCKFINILRKIPHFGYSVIHGNPYIHMGLLDYKDGSSFEVLVNEPNQIVILPQIRASSTSLERIIGHIIEEFREGNVEDYTWDDRLNYE